MRTGSRSSSARLSSARTPRALKGTTVVMRVWSVVWVARARKWRSASRKSAWRRDVAAFPCLRAAGEARSQNVAREVLVLDERGEMPVDVRGVDAVALTALVRGLERDLVEQPLEHRVQAPRADVLGALVDLER